MLQEIALEISNTVFIPKLASRQSDSHIGSGAEREIWPGPEKFVIIGYGGVSLIL